MPPTTAVLLVVAVAAVAVSVCALVVASQALSRATTACGAVNDLLHEIVAPGASGRAHEDDGGQLRTLSD